MTLPGCARVLGELREAVWGCKSDLVHEQSDPI